MDDRDLDRELQRLGTERATELAPDTLTADVVNGWSDREERVLRLQYEDGQLPHHWEQELRSFDTTRMVGALRRWALLKHIYRVRSERLQARSVADPAKEDAARRLLRREPVVVFLAGHRTEITGRSYSAMAEIAAHSLRIQLLETERDDLRLEAATVSAALKQVPRWRFSERRPLKESLASIADRYADVATECELHRRSLYAHALTSHGGPANDPIEESPRWWREIGPEDDATLLAALFRVGPMRYRTMGDPPQTQRDGKVDFVEELGFASLFRAWEPKMGLEPAELYDRDLGQTLAAIRSGAVDYSAKA